MQGTAAPKLNGVETIDVTWVGRVISNFAVLARIPVLVVKLYHQIKNAKGKCVRVKYNE